MGSCRFNWIEIRFIEFSVLYITQFILEAAYPEKFSKFLKQKLHHVKLFVVHIDNRKVNVVQRLLQILRSVNTSKTQQYL